MLNILGGFAAALLVHSEVSGISAVCVHSVVDSHYVSSETLQSFSPVIIDVLGISDFKIEQVARLPAFKTVLKEVNNRGNNIFN